MKILKAVSSLTRALAGTVILTSLVVAQSVTSEPKYLVNKEAGAVCEKNNLYIDLLVREANKTNQKIFIISRLGDGEQSKLGWRRLRKAEFFLTSGKEIPPSRIIIAAGRRLSKAQGRLEFYLGSNLFLLSEAEKGKDVCLNCCDSP